MRFEGALASVLALRHLSGGRVCGMRRPLAAAYALQLSLNALQLLVTRHAQETGAIDGVDLQAVLQSSRQAPSSMARAAALSLLAQLASTLPRPTLEHIIQVRTQTAPHRLCSEFQCCWWQMCTYTLQSSHLTR